MNMKMSNAALAYFNCSHCVFKEAHLCRHKYFPLFLSCYYAPKIDHNVRER